MKKVATALLIILMIPAMASAVEWTKSIATAASHPEQLRYETNDAPIVLHASDLVIVLIIGPNAEDGFVKHRFI